MQLGHRPKISLLAFDLDGTLLNRQRRILDSNISTLHQLMARGIKVTVCSGRMPYAQRRYVEQMGFIGPYVAGNGCLIAHSADDAVLFSKPMTKAQVDRLCAFIRDKGLRLSLQTKDGVFYSRDQEHFTPEWLEELARKFGLGEDQVGFLAEDFRYSGGDPVLKATLNIPAEYNFEPIRQYLEAQPGFTYSYSDRSFVEIHAKGTDKGTGIQFVADYYKIPLAEVCVFGDYDNDIPAFALAGVSVAMGNASPNLKARAMYITDTNENDGVGKALAALTGSQ